MLLTLPISTYVHIHHVQYNAQSIYSWLSHPSSLYVTSKGNGRARPSIQDLTYTLYHAQPFFYNTIYTFLSQIISSCNNIIASLSNLSAISMWLSSLVRCPSCILQCTKKCTFISQASHLKTYENIAIDYKTQKTTWPPKPRMIENITIDYKALRPIWLALMSEIKTVRSNKWTYKLSNSDKKSYHSNLFYQCLI